MFLGTFARRSLPSALRSALLPALLGLAGCDLATDPLSLSVQFVPDHDALQGGGCEVNYFAQALGLGTAEWQRVTVTRDGEVAQEYGGAETAEFWGGRSISAGEQQESAPFTMAAGEEVSIEVVMQLRDNDRTVVLYPDCEDAD